MGTRASGTEGVAVALLTMAVAPLTTVIGLLTMAVGLLATGSGVMAASTAREKINRPTAVGFFVLARLKGQRATEASRAWCPALPGSIQNDQRTRS
jgi:hypothetical protein